MNKRRNFYFYNFFIPKLTSASIKRNTLINLLGSVVPILVSLATVPLYLHLIGHARYGVLAVVWALLGYFGLFDIGMGQAIANQVARLRDAPARETETTFWTALLVNVAFGIIGSMVMLFIGHILLGSMFKIPSELRPEVQPALIWLAVAVPLVAVSSVLFGALEGQERFLTVNILSTLTNLLFQTLPVVVAFTSGPNLAGLIGAVVLVRLGSVGFALFACIKYLSLGSWPRFDVKKVGPLCRYGGWITIAGLLNPYLLRPDQVVIGMKAGVQVLPQFNIPYNLAMQIMLLPTSLSRSLFPRFSRLKSDDVRAAGKEACLGLAILITPIIVFGIVMLKPFFELWIGSVLADSAAPIGQILLLGIWFNGLALVPYTLLQSQGRADLTAKFHLVEIIPYVLTLWLGATIAGLPGVAWVWVLRVIVDAGLLFSVARFPWASIRPLIFPAALILLASLSSLTLFAQLAPRVLLGGGFVLASLLWAWYAAPQNVKTLLRRFDGVWREVRAVRARAIISERIE